MPPTEPQDESTTANPPTTTAPVADDADTPPVLGLLGPSGGTPADGQSTIPPGPPTLVAPLLDPADPADPVVAGSPGTSPADPADPAAAGPAVPAVPVVPGSGAAPVVVDTQGRPVTCVCSGSQVSLLPPGAPGTPGGPAVEPVPGLLPGAVVTPIAPDTVEPDTAPAVPGTPVPGTPVPGTAPVAPGAEPTPPAAPPVVGLLPGADVTPVVPGTADAEPGWFEQYLDSTQPPAPTPGLQSPPPDTPVQTLAPDGIYRGTDQNVIFLNTGDEVQILGDDNAVFAPDGDGRDVQLGGDRNHADLGGGDDNYAAAYGEANTVLIGDGDRNDAVVADGDDNYVEIGDGVDNNATAGRGHGNFAVVGDGARSRALTGAGSGNRAQAGNGDDNEAIAGGPGNGNLALVGNGNRNRAIVGEGDGNMAVAGDGDHNLTRTGRGNGNTTLTGNGIGNRTQVGSGQGNVANGVPVAPGNYRPFTPTPLPQSPAQSPAQQPAQPPGQPPGQPQTPDYGGGAPLTIAGVIVDLANNGPRAVSTYRDAAARHTRWAQVFADRAAAAGNPAAAAAYRGLAYYRTHHPVLNVGAGNGFADSVRQFARQPLRIVNPADWYRQHSAGLENRYTNSRGARYLAGTGVDWFNRRISEPGHPRLGERINVRENFNITPRPSTAIHSFGPGELLRRGATKVGGLFGVPAAIGDAVYGVVAQGEPIPHAIGRTGSSLLVGTAGGALGAAGVAAIVPGAGWAVAGGIVAGAYIGDAWGRSGAADRVGRGFDEAGDAFGQGDVLGGLGAGAAGIGEAGAAFVGQVGQDIGNVGSAIGTGVATGAEAVGDFFSGMFG